VLAEAVQGGRDALTVLPPLHVYETRGRYTAEMQAIFQGRALGIEVTKAASMSVIPR